MSLEREFLFISVRHSFSHLILPGIRVPLESSTTRTTTRAGETGGEKLLSREDVTEMAEQRLQNYGTYLNIGEPQSRKVYRRRGAIPLSNRQRDTTLGNASDDDARRSKLQRFNKSIRPRGGVKSLTGNGMGGETEPEDYDKPKKMKKIGEPVQCVRVHRFEIKYVNVTTSFSFP